MKRSQYAEITGDSVRIRPVEASDAEDAYPLLQDGAVTRTLLWDGPVSMDELAGAYALRRDWWRDGTGEYTFTIKAVEPESLIGALGLHVPEDPRQVSIGYWLGQPFWGRGFATEAVRLALHLAFRHIGASCVVAAVFTGNPASRRVLEKNGFRVDATVPGARPKRGELLDEWRLSLPREDWAKRDGLYRPSAELVAPL